MGTLASLGKHTWGQGAFVDATGRGKPESKHCGFLGSSKKANHRGLALPLLALLLEGDKGEEERWHKASERREVWRPTVSLYLHTE